MLANEKENGMYYLTSHFMATSLVGVPMESTMPSLFILILSLMARMRGPSSIFFVRLMVIYLIVLKTQVCTPPYCSLPIYNVKLVVNL